MYHQRHTQRLTWWWTLTLKMVKLLYGIPCGCFYLSQKTTFFRVIFQDTKLPTNKFVQKPFGGVNKILRSKDPSTESRMLHFLVSPWGSTLACCKLGGDLVSSPTPGVELHWNNPKTQKGRGNRVFWRLEVCLPGGRVVLPWGFGARCFFFQFFYTQWVDIYIYIYWTLWLKIVWSPPERNGWLKGYYFLLQD